MSKRAATYNVISDFGSISDDGYITSSPFWVIAVIRLNFPLSFSRKTMTSVTLDPSQGALLRNIKPLIITDDCINLQVSRDKNQCTSSLSATLKQTEVNYLTELFPGDHVMAWIVNNREDFVELCVRIDDGEPCNDFDSGLKFIGRVHDVRKTLSVSQDGMKTSSYSLQCVGFDELNTSFFYDDSLSSVDKEVGSLGLWLTRVGLEYQELFKEQGDEGFQQNNINSIIPALLDLIVGKGPRSNPNINVLAANGSNLVASPQFEHTDASKSASYAYMIPKLVGQLLGKKPSKGGDVMGYGDILELLQGVQSYENKYDTDFETNRATGIKSFVPALKEYENDNRRITTKSMLGTFIPYMPEFCNKPLWDVLHQYLNPTINEIYTCLRVNPDAKIVPTIVLRQIPFTTDAFSGEVTETFSEQEGPEVPGLGDPLPRKKVNIGTTKFLDMPRWVIPASMITHVDIGRTNAYRFNFVHIYGASSCLARNNPIGYQIVNNPPIRDDLDIMRSGLKPYMSTVECFVNDQIGLVPGIWMALVADWSIGQHLTLNGSLRCKGIQAPITHGDNLQFDGVVYHIESVVDNCSIDGQGHKTWTTSFQLANGMRDTDSLTTDNEFDAHGNMQPIYPGFNINDNTKYNPGLTLDQRASMNVGSTRAVRPTEAPAASSSASANVDGDYRDASGSMLNPKGST